MQVIFHKILIPVDFSTNTEVAVKKAIGLADPASAHIQLLHIVKPPGLWERFGKGRKAGSRKTDALNKYAEWEADRKLEQWKSCIEEYAPGIRVEKTVRTGSSVQAGIVEFSKTGYTDLIIIGKLTHRGHRFLSGGVSPDQIAKASNCPVLTVKPGSLYHRTRLIVIPVGDFVPARKLELAILIARKCRAQVHLVAITPNLGSGQEFLSQAFLQAYHQIREIFHHPVEYFNIGKDNAAKGILKYAESVMADMILLNPGTESGVPSWAGNRHISELLEKDSKIQIMDVQPYQAGEAFL